jgi:hypothetical protein
MFRRAIFTNEPKLGKLVKNSNNFEIDHTSWYKIKIENRPKS